MTESRPPRGAPAESSEPASSDSGAAVPQSGPTGRSERTFAKDVASLEEIFGFLKQFIDGHRLDPDLEFCLDFVTEEIFTNMVKYNTGPNQEIVLAVERLPDEVRLELTDFDVDPFDPEDAEKVDVGAPIEKRRPGGLGLHLVKSLVDRLTYEYRNRELKVSICKRLA